MLYPLTLQPLFKERVWGGQRLADLYHKPLPAGASIGESWEVSDRPGDENIITNGHFAGKSLRWLMTHHLSELLGDTRPQGERFPLLVKILDAQDKLSLQVHPPAALASNLHGEPKTEMWYIAHAEPGAELFVGLKPGVTRTAFEQAIPAGQLADCFHRITVKSGDAMFLPSGRVHAIGAGLVIFEIQQNSDTTYRVFDWNRLGLDGKPRALHIAESLASIDFNDVAPELIEPVTSTETNHIVRTLVQDPLFTVSHIALTGRGYSLPRLNKPQIIGALWGQLTVTGSGSSVLLSPGQFTLIPACVSDANVSGDTSTSFILANPQ